MARLVWLLFLWVVVLGAAGCASTDPDDSARPWNAPRNWETGLPSNMIDRR